MRRVSTMDATLVWAHGSCEHLRYLRADEITRVLGNIIDQLIWFTQVGFWPNPSYLRLSMFLWCQANLLDTYVYGLDVKTYKLRWIGPFVEGEYNNDDRTDVSDDATDVIDETETGPHLRDNGQLLGDWLSSTKQILFIYPRLVFTLVSDAKKIMLTPIDRQTYA